MAQWPAPAARAGRPACSPAAADQAGAAGADWVVENAGLHLRAASDRACRQGDTLYVADWVGPGAGPGVVPYGGEARRIEDLFEELQGTLWVDGVAYRISDGVFKSLKGVRAWVAFDPRPRRAAPVSLHVALLELDGAIYYAGLHLADGPPH